jgi:hypothetical protein
MGSIESGISQNLETQLRNLVENARKIHAERLQQFKNELSPELVWLRPAVGGISAISCTANSPQLGFKD